MVQSGLDLRPVSGIRSILKITLASDGQDITISRLSTEGEDKIKRP